MNAKSLPRFLLLSALCLIFLLFSGCSAEKAQPVSSGFTPGKSRVLTPSADNREVIGQAPLLLDISNTREGYFIGTVSGTSKTVHLQVIGPDGITYQYFIEQEHSPTVFPLTAGSGSYTILAFENITADQYASLFVQTIEVELNNEFLPFLYPNQFVNFSENSEAVTLAVSLTKDASTDLDALTAIYDYVTSAITYDNEKAASVSGNYLPDVDQTLRTKTGICFDYAALTTAMLRSLGIPSRLAIGYSADVKHAWIDVYIESKGWIKQAIEFNGSEWKFMDPTFAATGSMDTMAEYTGDGSNYYLEYIR
jgi:hypothetical protein